MRKAVALLALPLVLQGCSYSYPIWATMVGGRLAFESGDRDYDCFTNISVTAAGPLAPDPARDAIEDPLKRGEAESLARAAWRTDAVATYECKGHFPVVYGAPMPGITIVAAKPLRIGVPYAVSTYGPKGTGGHGCFRINPDRRPENISDHLCSLASPPPQPAPPPPPGSVVSPAQPRADLAALIGPADYPASALKLKQEGTVVVALDVGSGGRVEQCTVTHPSGAAALDSATCRILSARARFTPAKDNMGNAVPSRVEQVIAWTLPGGTGAALPPGSSRQLHTIPGVPGGMASHSVSPPPAVAVHTGIAPTPINALPPPEETGPTQMYALTPYRGIERWLREYPSLAACEAARSRMASEQADRRLCGFGPKRPR